MKKTIAVISTLSVAATLIASSAMADTSTTTVTATEERLIDKITASYWGQYWGPSISNPTRASVGTDTAEITDLQNIDSTFTLGYKLNKELTVGVNYRNIYQPLTNEGGGNIITKDPWLSIKRDKLISSNGLNMSIDGRVYVPVQTEDRMNVGFRSTQTTTYDIPGSRLTLGAYTYERVNLVRANNYYNFDLDLSFFTNYQLTPTVALTGWTDILQYDVKFGQGFSNLPVDVALGVNWDITPQFSFNPQLVFYPQTLRMETTTIGAILSAKFL